MSYVPADKEYDPLIVEICRCLEYVRQLTGRFDRRPDNAHYWHVREACAGLCVQGGLSVAHMVDLHDKTSGVRIPSEPGIWLQVAPPELIVEEVLSS